jgi:hypothetical protein
MNVYEKYEKHINMMGKSERIFFNFLIFVRSPTNTSQEEKKPYIF